MSETTPNLHFNDLAVHIKYDPSLMKMYENLPQLSVNFREEPKRETTKLKYNRLL